MHQPANQPLHDIGFSLLPVRLVHVMILPMASVPIPHLNLLLKPSLPWSRRFAMPGSDVHVACTALLYLVLEGALVPQ